MFSCEIQLLKWANFLYWTRSKHIQTLVIVRLSWLTLTSFPDRLDQLHVGPGGGVVLQL